MPFTSSIEFGSPGKSAHRKRTQNGRPPRSTPPREEGWGKKGKSPAQKHLTPSPSALPCAVQGRCFFFEISRSGPSVAVRGGVQLGVLDTSLYDSMSLFPPPSSSLSARPGLLRQRLAVLSQEAQGSLLPHSGSLLRPQEVHYPVLLGQGSSTTGSSQSILGSSHLGKVDFFFFFFFFFFFLGPLPPFAPTGFPRRPPRPPLAAPKGFPLSL